MSRDTSPLCAATTHLRAHSRSRHSGAERIVGPRRGATASARPVLDNPATAGTALRGEAAAKPVRNREAPVTEVA
jgi:hypothetical protein